MRCVIVSRRQRRTTFGELVTNAYGFEPARGYVQPVMVSKLWRALRMVRVYEEVIGMKHVLERESADEAEVRSDARRWSRPQFGKHGAFDGAGAAESRSRMIRARLNAAVLRRWVSRGNTVARFGGAS